MEEKRYILVWRDTFNEVEKLDYDEFKEFMSGWENVEVLDIGNGLISYMCDDGSWMIVELE